MGVRKDRPPPEGQLQKDKSNVKSPSTDAGSASGQTIPPATTSKSPVNTASPDAGSTDHPPAPLGRNLRSFFQRAKEQKGEKTVKSETQSATHVQEKAGDRTTKVPSTVCEKESDDKGTGVRLKKELGLIDCVGIIVGSIIGSGIFVSPRAVLQYTGSPGMSLVVWAATGLVSMMGALCYAELGTMIPQSGGSITYLYEAYGPIPAFLEIWMSVLIDIPGHRAIVALSFANYVLQPFFPSCQEPPQAALRIVGILLIFLLTWINTRKVKWATTVQDVLALTKVLALIMIIIVGLNHLAWGRSRYLDDPMAGTTWDPSLQATAFYHTMFAYSGWGALNSIMEELKNPSRNMPLAIAISLVTVTVIYILTNVAYFAVLSPEQLLSSTAVAVTFGNLVLGVMAWTIPIFVACSTGGGLNGSIFGSSRVLFVSARRGHLPKVLSFVHAHDYTPVTSLVFMACISLTMFVTSDVRVLINYTGFSGNLLGLMSLSTIFWFRIKQPERHRPVKVWIGFPILYFIVSIFLMVFPVVNRPVEVFVSLLIVAAGLPVYYLAIHRPNKPKPLQYAMDRVTYVCQMLFQAVPEEKKK